MKAFIEKNSVGEVFVFLDTKEGDVMGANGVGNTLEEAKADLMECIDFAIECLKDEGIEVPDYLLNRDYEYSWLLNKAVLDDNIGKWIKVKSNEYDSYSYFKPIEHLETHKSGAECYSCDSVVKHPKKGYMFINHEGAGADGWAFAPDTIWDHVEVVDQPFEGWEKLEKVSDWLSLCKED